jgi:hypothetical protein
MPSEESLPRHLASQFFANQRNPGTQHCFDEQPIVVRGGARITNLAWQSGCNPFPLVVVEDRANQG